MKNWKNITQVSDIHKIIEESHTRPQVIFKDSVTCGISAYAKERLDLGTSLLMEKAALNYLDLLSYRSVSNFIESELKIRHQSPQIIVLKNGKATYTSSHHSIDPKTIAANL